MKYPKIFVTLIAVVFVAIVVVFCFLPRSRFSELERRELAEFPSFTIDSLVDGSWAQAVSAWFSDTEPYRDEILAASMQIKGNLGINSLINAPEDALTFHAPEADEAEVYTEDYAAPVAFGAGTGRGTVNDHGELPRLPDAHTDSIGAYTNNINADEVNTKIGHSGILVAGTAPNARAMMAFGATGSAGTEFARLVSRYRQEFGGKINVYCMVIPNSIEFYCPDKAKKITKPQIDVINNIYQHLTDGARGVDCYTPLSQHVGENIFLRTDHHWAPRGAYYAAQAFARTAGVPFADLSTYDEHVVHNFVGTMYGYSKDIAVKQSPEDFVYWTPTGVDYETTYIVYNVDKNLHVTGEGRPYKGQFFFKFKDGSGAAYSTFMGGDQKITQVRTSTKNGRRLVIFKDSFGNALPGYLFHSFEEIHVIDYRYFTRNFRKYAEDNGITDILFAHSVFMCLGGKALSSYNRFLTQNGSISAPKPEPKKDAVPETAPKDIPVAVPSADTPQSQPITEPQPVPQPETKPEASPVTEPETQTKTEPETKPEPQPEPSPGPSAPIQTQTGPSASESVITGL